MIDREHDLSITRQAEVLQISRGSVYYLPRPVPDADLAIMQRLDGLHLEHPFAGSRMLRGLLALQECKVGRRHVKTLMKRMGILFHRFPSDKDREIEQSIQDLKAVHKITISALERSHNSPSLLCCATFVTGSDAPHTRRLPIPRNSLTAGMMQYLLRACRSRFIKLNGCRCPCAGRLPSGYAPIDLTMHS